MTLWLAFGLGIIVGEIIMTIMDKFTNKYR